MKRDDTPMTPERIKAIRTALGLTQAEFAARLETTCRHIQRWEYAGENAAVQRAPRGPSAAMLRALEREAEQRNRAKASRMA
jgi:DNA-binding transcriptional regulator YiaG